MSYSPLAIDAVTVKEFDIDKESDFEDEGKLAFCRAQRDEYLKVLWRERLELIIAKKQEESKDAGIRAESSKNVLTHELGIQQFVRAIKVLNVLVTELETKLAK